MQNQTVFELYADDNKLKYSSNPKNILISAKGKKEKKEKTLHQQKQPREVFSKK